MNNELTPRFRFWVLMYLIFGVPSIFIGTFSLFYFVLGPSIDSLGRWWSQWWGL